MPGRPTGEPEHRAVSLAAGMGRLMLDNRPMATVRLALCQLNPTVGDIAANESAIAASLDAARQRGAQLVVFGELAVTGYPPEDLVYRSHFLRDARAAVERLAGKTAGIVAVVGFPEGGAAVHNSAAVLADGRLAAVYRKIRLPNYGVFDEQRYFRAGDAAGLIELGEHRVGITICEDIWQPGPPCSDLALAGATLVVNLSASPYHAGKGLERELMVTQRARENVAAFAFCALVGGQDELVFDGHSFVVDHTGALLARAAQFEEELLLCDVDLAAPDVERRRRSANRVAPLAGSARAELLATLAMPSTASGSDDGFAWRGSPRCSSRSRRRSTPRCAAACVTTCARTASPMWCLASRAASTQRWWRRSPWMRSAPLRSASS